jgi:PKD repeat protein
MRDSNYVRTFPLKTPYFVVSSAGVLNTTPVFAEWLAGLGLNADTGVVFIEGDDMASGFATKTSASSPAQVLVPMDYISRMQASSGTLTVIGPLTVAYNLPLPSATQNIFAFKNGALQTSVPATIPTSTSDTWAIVVTNDKTAAAGGAQYSATLAANPLTGTHASTLITFTLTETNKPSGATGSYSWNFGDGSAVTVTATPSTTYTYPTAGTFTAKCTPTINGVTQAQVTAAAPAVIS